MGISLRYETVESGRFVVEQLYLNDREEPEFMCEIKVPIPRPDSVAEGTLILWVRRIYDAPESYTHSNDDRVYRTRAHFTFSDELFDIDIVVYSREAEFTGATVSVSPEANRIIREALDR